MSLSIHRPCYISSLLKGLDAIVNEREDLRGRLEFMKLDLSSFASTKKFADDFKKKYRSLHILVNNAGIAYVPFGEQ